MPIYEYQCQSCGERREVLQRMSDPPLETCEDCGGEVRKLISAPAFQFKGSGWYVTDYARKGQEGGEKTGASESSDTTGSDAASTSAKTDKAAKTEAKSSGNTKTASA